jgi:hypothetical protein
VEQAGVVEQAEAVDQTELHQMPVVDELVDFAS